MSKENQNKKYGGQNRCRRCDRPLSDPNDIYGWRCAQILGLDRYKQIVSSLDENAMEMYNRYIVDYLYKDGQTPANNVAIASYNAQEPTNQGTVGILNTGYDEAGVWHNWDAERYETDSPEYKMLTGLNKAYERANTYRHWQGDKERIAHLAATLKVTDTSITDVILLNNSEGAGGFGHNALLLMNPHGQGFLFSYYGPENYPWDDTGEMRFSVLSADEVNEIKDRSGEVKEAVTIYGDRRWENGKAAYDRFVWCDVPNMEAGKDMLQYAVNMFVNPGDYNLFGQQCDDVASKILSAGGIGYENKLLPNSSYELYKQNKTYWMNETGISRGVEL